MIKRKIIKNEKGQTLIEIIIALAVSVIVVTAITVVVNSSLSNAQFSKNQNLATHYAEEGMEYMRKIRNQDWKYYNSESTFKFLEEHTTWAVSCLGSNLVLGPLDSPTGTCGTFDSSNSFIRTVRGEKESTDCGVEPGVDIRKVTVTVAWSDSKCNSDMTGGDNFGIPALFCHKIQLSSCFSDTWRIPAP